MTKVAPTGAPAAAGIDEMLREKIARRAAQSTARDRLGGALRFGSVSP